MGVIARFARRLLWAGLAVLALTVAAVLFLSERNLRLYGQDQALAAPVDAVLVLGGGMDGDGVLAYSSRRRVAAAVALLETGQARRLIFSGGRLRRSPIPTVAEGMRNYAISLGAPPEALLLEDAAVSTFENLRFGLAVAEACGLSRLGVLTDAFHLERVRRLAAYFGRPDIVLIAVRGLEFDSPGDRVWSILREALAWWYNLAKVTGWEALRLAGLDAQSRQEWIR